MGGGRWEVGGVRDEVRVSSVTFVMCGGVLFVRCGFLCHALHPASGHASKPAERDKKTAAHKTRHPASTNVLGHEFKEALPCVAADLPECPDSVTVLSPVHSPSHPHKHTLARYHQGALTLSWKLGGTVTMRTCGGVRDTWHMSYA